VTGVRFLFRVTLRRHDLFLHPVLNEAEALAGSIGAPTR